MVGKLIARLLIGGILVGVVSLVVISFPDISRYLKMRRM